MDFDLQQYRETAGKIGQHDQRFNTEIVEFLKALQSWRQPKTRGKLASLFEQLSPASQAEPSFFTNPKLHDFYRKQLQLEAEFDVHSGYELPFFDPQLTAAVGVLREMSQSLYFGMFSDLSFRIKENTLDVSALEEFMTDLDPAFTKRVLQDLKLLQQELEVEQRRMLCLSDTTDVEKQTIAARNSTSQSNLLLVQQAVTRALMSTKAEAKLQMHPRQKL